MKPNSNGWMVARKSSELGGGVGFCVTLAFDIPSIWARSILDRSSRLSAEKSSEKVVNVSLRHLLVKLKFLVKPLPTWMVSS